MGHMKIFLNSAVFKKILCFPRLYIFILLSVGSAHFELNIRKVIKFEINYAVLSQKRQPKEMLGNKLFVQTPRPQMLNHNRTERGKSVL